MKAVFFSRVLKLNSDLKQYLLKETLIRNQPIIKQKQFFQHLIIQYLSIKSSLLEVESLYCQVQALPNIQTQSRALRITSHIIKDNDLKLSTPI